MQDTQSIVSTSARNPNNCSSTCFLSKLLERYLLHHNEGTLLLNGSGDRSCYDSECLLDSFDQPKPVPDKLDTVLRNVAPRSCFTSANGCFLEFGEYQ
jgi:hypothetical protein